jgi:glycosyltransferase involved in cell wall biosynthesis
LSDKRLVAVSFAYPPMMAAMSVLVWRLLRHSGLGFTVVRGEDGRSTDPGLAGMAGDGAGELHSAGFMEPPLHLLARRVLYGTPLLQLLQIPDIYRSWVPQAAARALPVCSADRDVLVTFASPMSSHLVGLEIRRRLPGIPWAAYFGDPWTNNPMIRRFGPAAYLHRRLERRVIAGADLLIYPCEEMRDFALAACDPAVRARSRVVAHGYEGRLYPGTVPRGEGPFTIRHLGSLYGSRTPSDLVSALELLGRDRPAALERMRFEFYGTFPGGCERNGLPEGLLTFHPPVSYLESLGLMSSADALLVITPSEEMSGVFLPSKLIDYMGAGRPVIGICRPGACSRLVERLGGWVSETGDPSSVADCLVSLVAFLEGRRGSAVPWGEPSVRSAYSAENTGRIFRTFMEELF